MEWNRSSQRTQKGKKRLCWYAMLMTLWVRPEVACVEWSKEAPSLVSRAVSNPSLRHWQRWGGKRGVTSKEASSRTRQPGKGKIGRMNANEPSMRLRDVAVIGTAKTMMNGTTVPAGSLIAGTD